MIKKIATLVLLNAVLMTPIMSLAAISGATQLGTAAKMAGPPQVIRLSSNDLTHIQGDYKKSATKTELDDGMSKEVSKISPQVWLVLIALFCFVMRSSRRTV